MPFTNHQSFHIMEQISFCGNRCICNMTGLMVRKMYGILWFILFLSTYLLSETTLPALKKNLNSSFNSVSIFLECDITKLLLQKKKETLNKYCEFVSVDLAILEIAISVDLL